MEGPDCGRHSDASLTNESKTSRYTARWGRRAAACILAVEILSDGDTLAATKKKCDEYIAMGAQGVWIINPLNRTAWHWLGNAWKEAACLEVPGTPIFVEVQYLWDRLDQPKA